MLRQSGLLVLEIDALSCLCQLEAGHYLLQFDLMIEDQLLLHIQKATQREIMVDVRIYRLQEVELLLIMDQGWHLKDAQLIGIIHPVDLTTLISQEVHLVLHQGEVMWMMVTANDMRGPLLHLLPIQVAVKDALVIMMLYLAQNVLMLLWMMFPRDTLILAFANQELDWNMTMVVVVHSMVMLMVIELEDLVLDMVAAAGVLFLVKIHMGCIAVARA